LKRKWWVVSAEWLVVVSTPFFSFGQAPKPEGEAHHFIKSICQFFVLFAYIMFSYALYLDILLFLLYVYAWIRRTFTFDHMTAGLRALGRGKGNQGM